MAAADIPIGTSVFQPFFGMASQVTNDATESDSDGFEIISDVSDEDLLLLKVEIKRTKSTKTQRDLAAATIELEASPPAVGTV